MRLILETKSYLQKFLRRGSLFHQLLIELKNNERLSYEQLLNYQNQKLRSTIRHAYQTVPYYRRLFDKLKLAPEAIQTVSDLPLLPIIGKSDIRGKEKQFVSNKLSWKFKTTTSGTTGTPVDLYRDYYSINLEHASIWRQRYWGECFLGEPMVSIRGDVVVPPQTSQPPFWKTILSENKLMMSPYHLSDRFIPFYLEQLRQFNPSFIEGYPGCIYRLARYMELHRESPINVKAVFTSSEALIPHHRQVIEQYFGRVLDHYGQSERVAHIARCKHGEYHYVMDYSIVEFLPTEHNGLYRVVGTSLHNGAMPLIRYDTKDFVRLSNRTCSCGRAFPVIDLIEGRLEDYIATPCGKFIGAMGIVFVGVPNLIEGQIVQEDIDSIRILIVPTEKFTADDENKLLNNVRQRLGTDMKIFIQKVKAIQRTKTGKFKLTLSKLSPEYQTKRELSLSSTE